jgi:hypothetical protein
VGMSGDQLVLLHLGVDVRALLVEHVEPPLQQPSEQRAVLSWKKTHDVSPLHVDDGQPDLRRVPKHELPFTRNPDAYNYNIYLHKSQYLT